LLFHGKFKKVWGNEELKTYLAIILVSSLIITVYIAPWGQLTWEKAFRDSLFQVASIITATGFASADYQVWPQTAKMVILLVMLVGACAGSTGGGIKVARYVVIYKNFTQTMRRLVRPNSVQVARFNGQPISAEASAGILGFVFIYIMTILLGSFIIMGTGLDYVSAFSSVITTLGGIGPGFNVIGPIANFSSLTDFAKIYLSLNMILGRLEIMTVLILLTPAFYRR
jgi:trk system potassium uptake protein